MTKTEQKRTDWKAKYHDVKKTIDDVAVENIEMEKKAGFYNMIEDMVEKIVESKIKEKDLVDSSDVELEIENALSELTVVR